MLFRSGDSVRIRIKQGTFAKGDTVKFSTEIYKVTELDGRKYLLSNGKRYGEGDLVLANKSETPKQLNTRSIKKGNEDALQTQKATQNKQKLAKADIALTNKFQDSIKNLPAKRKRK